MSKKNDLKALLKRHSQRLQILREQEAIQGFSAEPKIIIEIEDIEKKIANIKSELNTLLEPGESQVPVEDSHAEKSPPSAIKLEPSSTKKNTSTKNPWKSGTFYLITFFLSVSAYLFASSVGMSNYQILVAFSVGVATMFVVGILQLRNDDQLSDASFTNLMIEFLKRFPFFKRW